MIEFKAKCGHTVYARNEDAGRNVRCSYCGRDASVPGFISADLDNLLSGLEETGEEDQEFNRQQRRENRRRKRKLRKRSTVRFDPFALVIKLCYISMLIAIVYVITDKFIFTKFKDPAPEQYASQNVDHQNPSVQNESSQRRNSATRHHAGLQHVHNTRGLYVVSTPSGASVHVIEQFKALDSGRIAYMEGASKFHPDESQKRLLDGTYAVEVAFRWNDPRLCNPGMPDYEKFLAFRREIMAASTAQRHQLLEEYFIPDEATDFFVDETSDQIYFVRQYRDVVVRGTRSAGVRALFLPRTKAYDQSDFSIELLLKDYLLVRRSYGFDESSVLYELAFFDVKSVDRKFVIEALSRIGIIPYVTPSGDTRLFKIGIHNGEFASQIVRVATE